MMDNRTVKQWLKYWLLPEGIRQSLSRARKVLAGASNLTPEEKAVLERNAELRNRHQGQRCFILATGPSINKQDLSVLEGELCIGVGFFFFHPLIARIRPAYHVFAPSHPPFDFDIMQRQFDGMRDRYYPKTTIFYGHRSYEFSIINYMAQPGFNSPCPVHIMNYDEGFHLDKDNYKNEEIWDITGRRLFQPRTVVFCAIQLATYMGCSPIYLLGCDNDYLQDLTRRENHFYREELGPPLEAVHLAAITTEQQLMAYYLRWRDYRLMQTYLSTRGIHIFNATEGGMLDVFPRVSLRDLPGLCRSSITF